MSRRALAIYNPAARGIPALGRVRAAAESVEGWDVSVEVTQGAGHATELAREAARRGLDAAVACGGDGTVNEVVNGLAESTTALAVVRGGTANVWAKEARLPKRPEKALGLLAEGERRTIDLGRAGERYFLLMAGVGFDAAIVREVSERPKRWLGAAAYVLYGIRRALSYRPVEVDLVVDGEPNAGRLFWLLLANTHSYAGVLNVAHLAEVDDGELDLWVLRQGGLWRLASLIPSVLLRRHHKRGDILYRRAASLDIRTPGLPVQADGEPLGETPMRFEVVPGALRVVVPKGLGSGLFREDGRRQ